MGCVCTSSKQPQAYGANRGNVPKEGTGAPCEMNMQTSIGVTPDQRFSSDLVPTRARPVRPVAHANTGSLHLLCELCQSSVPYGSRSVARVLCSVSADLLTQQLQQDVQSSNVDTSVKVQQSATVCIVAVVDTSTSMRGSKLKILQGALSFLFQQLRPTDYICVVSFNTEVEVALPMQQLRDASEVASATQAIHKLNAEGSTNLVDGVIQGLRELSDHATRQKLDRHASVCSLWVFTDGEVNTGLVHPSDIIGVIQKRINKLPVHCSLFAFGFGASHNDILLKEIAEVGSGMYYYLFERDHIVKSFADCLGGLLSVVAQEIQVEFLAVGDTGRIHLVNDVPVVRQRKKSVVLALNDMSEHENITLLFDLKISKLKIPRLQRNTVLTARLKYYDTLAKVPVVDVLHLAIDRPDDVADASDPVTAEAAHDARIEACKAMKRARLLVQQERNDAALAALEQAIGYVKNSRFVDDPVCVAVLADLQRCKGLLGKHNPLLTSLSLVYSKEKTSVNTCSDIYRTKMQTNYTVKAQENFSVLRRELDNELQLAKKGDSGQYKDLKLGPLVGRGTSGVVHSATNPAGQIFAVKTVDIGKNCCEKTLGLLRRELSVIRKLPKHPNLVDVLHVSVDTRTVQIIMEYCTTSLLSVLAKLQGKPMPIPQISQICRQMLHGLSYLHRHKIIHRDVKPENILFSNDGILKIADFGAGKVLVSATDAHTRIGTILYMAPEMFDSAYNQTPACDIWSLGVMTCQLATNTSPWSHLGSSHAVIVEHLRSEMRSQVRGSRTGPDIPLDPQIQNPSLTDFLTKCLRLIPEDRATADQLLEHQFVHE